MPKKIKFIQEIQVIDPDSNAPVDVAIYKDVESGGMFGVDSSYISQEIGPVYSPFVRGVTVDIDSSEADVNRHHSPPAQSYEVKFYETKQDFDDRRPFLSFDYDTKRDALKDVGKVKHLKQYEGRPIAVIKIQSNSREDIEIIEL